jgi:hypothetical protein
VTRVGELICLAMTGVGDLVPNVFVSYAHEDKPFAHRLAAGLGDQGREVWVDRYELRAGDSFYGAISNALVAVEFVVAWGRRYP